MKILIFFINLFYEFIYILKTKRGYKYRMKEYLGLNTPVKIKSFLEQISKDVAKWYKPMTQVYDIMTNRNINYPFVIYNLYKRIGYKCYFILLLKGKSYYDVVIRDKSGKFVLWNYGKNIETRSIEGCLANIGLTKFKIIKE